MGSPELEKTGVLERAKDQGMILARMVGTNPKKKGWDPRSWKEIRERERVGERRAWRGE